MARPKGGGGPFRENFDRDGIKSRKQPPGQDRNKRRKDITNPAREPALPMPPPQERGREGADRGIAHPRRPAFPFFLTPASRPLLPRIAPPPPTGRPDPRPS